MKNLDRNKKGIKKYKAQVSVMIENFLVDCIGYMHGRNEYKYDYLYEKYFEQYKLLHNKQIEMFMYFVDKVLCKKIESSEDEEANIELFKQLFLNDEIVKTSNVYVQNNNCHSLQVLIRKTKKCTSELYYLILDYVKVYELERKSGMTLNENLYIQSYKNNNLKFIENEFIKSIDSQEGLELFKFMIKVLCENADNRLASVLRKMRWESSIRNSGDLHVELLIYFNYFCNNIIVPESIKDEVRNILNFNAYGENSFLEYMKSYPSSSLKIGANLEDMENTQYRLDGLAYRIVLTHEYVSKYKVYFAIINNISNLDFHSVKRNALSSLVQMFNDEQLDVAHMEECKKFA
ncbi:MAG: hypothetical protein R3Y32_06990 [Bacillota bacterium]